MSRGTIALTVKGVSMAPTIRPGDRVRVRVATDAAIGDIVLVLGAAPRLHRVIRVLRHQCEPHVVTCGDSLGVCDPPAPMSVVLGRVITVNDRPVRTRLGWLLAWLARWQSGSGRRQRMAHRLRRLLTHLVR